MAPASSPLAHSNSGWTDWHHEFEAQANTVLEVMDSPAMEKQEAFHLAALVKPLRQAMSEAKRTQLPRTPFSKDGCPPMYLCKWRNYTAKNTA